MARLPTVEDMGARPTPRAPRPIVGYRGGVSEAAAAIGSDEVSQVAAAFTEKMAKEDAEREARDGLALAPGCVEGWLALCLALLDQNRPDDARRELEEVATDIFPVSPARGVRSEEAAQEASEESSAQSAGPQRLAPGGSKG